MCLHIDTYTYELILFTLNGRRRRRDGRAPCLATERSSWSGSVCALLFANVSAATHTTKYVPTHANAPRAVI